MPLKRKIVERVSNKERGMFGVTIRTTGYPKFSEEEVEYCRQHTKTLMGDVEVKD